MRRITLLLIPAVLQLFTVFAFSETAADSHQAIALGAAAAPGSELASAREIEMQMGDQRIVRNIAQPALLPYPVDPANNTGVAVIVAPGGGFKFLSIDQEGIFVAQWLNQRGINAYVLKYRLDETASGTWGFYWQLVRLFAGTIVSSWFSTAPDFPERALSPVQELAIEDALQAVALVRDRAADWQLRPDAIGILGFSAGGAVANGTALRGRDGSRPDFVASIYGVPVLGDIPPDAPPLFQAAADDDPIVPVQWSQTLHERWQLAGGDSVIKRYAEGGHGFGMRTRDLPTDDWIEQFYQWLGNVYQDQQARR